jgi:hypothetical protein
MLEVGKGSQHQLRIGFDIVQGFRQLLLFEMNLLTQTVRRRLHEGNLRYTYPLDASTPTGQFGPWSIHSGPCNTGDTFCSLLSPGSAYTSQIGVLESGEDKVNSFRLQTLLSMTATEVGQLWCWEASAGMDEPTGSAGMDEPTWLC